MKLAIMQPYIFPYIGYFQLLKSVDKFIIYDDVNFIKQGWINRNKVLVNGKEFLFTIPVRDISSFREIKDVEIDIKAYPRWKDKFLKTLVQAYKKAPFFYNIYNLVVNVLDTPTMHISDICKESLIKTNEYLGISTKIIETSKIYNNNSLTAQDRLIDICLKEAATDYINPPGGVNLYSKAEFAKHRINLEFLRSEKIVYKQFGNEFIQGLSIIDVMMFNEVSQIVSMLSNYEFF